MRIDKETADRIKAAIDIVEVIGDYVDLRRRGASYVGLCPFHDDHSPSFYVSPTRRRWHCYVCDEGGDAISFLRKKLAISYPEALKILAAKYSITIPEEYLSKEEWKKQKTIETLLAVNEATMEYYQTSLTSPDDTTGMDYFLRRGFTEDTVKRFQVGYAPLMSEVMGAVKERNLEMKYLMPSDSVMNFKSGKSLPVENGVGTIAQINGRFVDNFSGRVIFPWLNTKGQVVGFAGRKLDEATKGVEMKYRNSPESMVYHKSHELWGLYQAKTAMVKANEAFIVEGYTDAMMLSQTGIGNVVATAGVALSKEHAALLSRFTKNIVLVYDADAAGISAAQRGVNILLQIGMNVSVVLLPEGEDPDSFARTHSSDEVREYLTTHKQSFVAFLYDVMLKGITDPIPCASAINAILATISYVHDPILRALYHQELSTLTGLPESLLKENTPE